MLRMFILSLLVFFSLNAMAISPLKIKMEYTKYGPVFYPNDGQKTHPGVVVFHGSEGGGRAYHQLDAQLLAMHGFAALAFCYYQCREGYEDYSDPKVEFIDVSIDKAYEAFKWMKNSRYTVGQKTAILGTSKGAELTFLIAAITAQEGIVGPDAIAAHAVTDSAEVGFSWNWYSSKCWDGTDPKTATWNPVCGKAPPKQGEGFRPAHGNGCFATPQSPRGSYTYHSWTWKGSHDLVRTHQPIPLELYKGPIFFTHGMEDALWCVSKAQAVQERLRKAGRAAEVHLFPGESHGFKTAAEEKKMELLIDFLTRSLK